LCVGRINHSTAARPAYLRTNNHNTDHRAQYTVAESAHVLTRPGQHFNLSNEEDIEEACRGRLNDHDTCDANDIKGCSSPDGDFVTQLDWDEDLVASNPLTRAGADTEQTKSEGPTSFSAMNRAPAPPQLRQDTGKSSLQKSPGILGVHSNIMRPPSQSLPGPSFQPGEATRLLAKKGPLSYSVLPEQDSPHRAPIAERVHAAELGTSGLALQHRSSNASITKSARLVQGSVHVGQSTFGQTVYCALLHMDCVRFSDS
jgi:hypothetical protein